MIQAQRPVSRTIFFAIAVVVLATAGGGPGRSPSCQAQDSPSALTFMARSRVKQADGSFKVQLRPAAWEARQTAIIICDMWDDHYCRASAARVAEMAPRMNEVI